MSGKHFFNGLKDAYLTSAYLRFPGMVPGLSVMEAGMERSNLERLRAEHKRGVVKLFDKNGKELPVLEERFPGYSMNEDKNVAATQSIMNGHLVGKFLSYACPPLSYAIQGFFHGAIHNRQDKRYEGLEQWHDTKVAMVASCERKNLRRRSKSDDKTLQTCLKYDKNLRLFGIVAFVGLSIWAKTSLFAKNKEPEPRGLNPTANTAMIFKLPVWKND
jgi:hypothetical protein